MLSGPREEDVAGPKAKFSAAVIRSYDMSSNRWTKNYIGGYSSEPSHGQLWLVRCTLTLYPDGTVPSKPCDGHFAPDLAEGVHMVKLYVRMTSLASRALRADDRGVTSVEYGIMVALIAIVIITAVALVGTNLSALFNKVAGSL